MYTDSSSLYSKKPKKQFFHEYRHVRKKATSLTDIILAGYVAFFIHKFHHSLKKLFTLVCDNDRGLCQGIRSVTKTNPNFSVTVDLPDPPDDSAG